ncbi:unnamed protein product [Boreogadus saida]
MWSAEARGLETQCDFLRGGPEWRVSDLAGSHFLLPSFHFLPGSSWVNDIISILLGLAGLRRSQQAHRSEHRLTKPGT